MVIAVAKKNKKKQKKKNNRQTELCNASNLKVTNGFHCLNS